ncbi:4-alpha-glucanotransferase [[Clostridium] polysaccharolyticum]|uniref:4-alpha-glucanotransferase n=1 Tax=[Clostridium] polysaccharolyticum TaxID=29364 RepID=A0A1I0BHY7_9FIRM|nr:4-alpha-glucanotransferase [[Clostridium] polysaccharolyticum]SET05846.1 4-alpha-glucanotransferase [[Clostridium] polysaccharolyticum]
MRSSGILMHISSLPSPYGIGTLGKEAYEFVDFLKRAKQTYWQILPINQTSYGDSPYQSFSGYAGNPYFIDLTMLCEKGYLENGVCELYNWGDNETKVDYATMYQSRYELLHIVFENFMEEIPDEFEIFCWEQREWLEDYALFMALKDAHNGQRWQLWEEPLKFREENALEDARAKYSAEILFWKMTQYFFFEQWHKLKSYANRQGIQIVGDVPIYVAADSVDVWKEPEQFYLDEDRKMIEVAGCPPDAFCEDGQLWGNPLFNWDVMKEDGYQWWTRRIAYVSQLYDVVRIDHFRGFESYYAIPYGEKTAKNGHWRKGPGLDLFQCLKEKLGALHIIVEDLGYLTDEVADMVKGSGFPGMKVLQFAFDIRETSNYLPHTYDRHCVVYTGTHDNDTLLGWVENAPEESVEYAKEYLRLDSTEGYNWGMMKAVWASVGDTAFVTMQDLLNLGSEARMNTPSTLGRNWLWRATKEQISDELAERIAENMNLYARI